MAQADGRTGMSGPLQIAVVGHTNAGKTSLMRTLTRKRGFGEVSSRPATTRHVELAEIALGGEALIRLYDTPGLEDSVGLLAHLDDIRQSQGIDWTQAIDRLIADKALEAGFGQEAQALAQVRRVDVALYVVDARDPVRARHRDELEILGRCAIPVLPILNFVADGEAREDEWRHELARKNMHAIVAFDTVVFDETGEIALYAKIATMLDRFKAPLDRLVTSLKARRQQLRQASARLIAELLVDVAAARQSYEQKDPAAETQAAEHIKAAVRTREADCVKALIALHEFADEDYALTDLPIEHGQWTQDPFDPATLAGYGISAGKAVATGAAAGLAVDLMVGGLTLGAAAATGAALGFLFDTARKHGGKLMDRLSGIAAMTVSDATLMLLATRETALARALLMRGHGAVKPIAPGAVDIPALPRDISTVVKPARQKPHWSGINGGSAVGGGRRQEVVERLAKIIAPRLQ
jgi:hypothetical protein